MKTTVALGPGFVLLDGDGSEPAALVRRAAASPRPVIILGAGREEVDLVEGLAAGAADDGVKPFRLAELLGRVESDLRFAGQARSTDDVVPVGDVEIDRRLLDRGVGLSP